MTTNNVLLSLIDSDRDLRTAFVEAVSRLTRTPLDGCRVEREAYDPGDDGRASDVDFRFSRAGLTQCVMETKVDSGLTSDDQAGHYLRRRVDDGGALLLVTREPLLGSLVRQAEAQLGVTFPEADGVWRADVGDRRVVVCC